VRTAGLSRPRRWIANRIPAVRHDAPPRVRTRAAGGPKTDRRKRAGKNEPNDPARKAWSRAGKNEPNVLIRTRLYDCAPLEKRTQGIPGDLGKIGWSLRAPAIGVARGKTNPASWVVNRGSWIAKIWPLRFTTHDSRPTTHALFFL